MDREAVRREIRSFVARHRGDGLCATPWGEPLVGFADANDPLFRELKAAVSEDHLLPEDLLPGAKAVVAFFIPFGRSVARSNVRGEQASREWARAYVETNALIAAVNARLAALIEAQGFETALTPATHNFDPVRLISAWSHRHIAFVAGLGRFGVNNMLITEKGCCGRFGSFVTSLPLEGDSRPAPESCLHRAGLKCLRCVERCVGDALTPDGFDRARCYAVCRRNEELYRDLGTADVCGKCLTGLPCSWTNPVSASGQRSPAP
ncbi:MAG TPA: epoxyqueuosine reductase [Deltaproteobacteria bacterium]|jgi:epoxyqueuosine reductase QueG|nr:epoxyqueuosine reductase [Deltaproteobacteria bacterium]HOI08771.1 epoxyqueuosine reductase [Deltaproteobacteria bacterium]